MNQNIKYTICFLCGILIAHFLLKKNIEGLCPGEGNNASHVSDCNSVSQVVDCSNSYSGSGADIVSCYINGSSCNASSVNCSGIAIASEEEEEGEEGEEGENVEDPSNEQCVKPTLEILAGTSDRHKINLYNLDELPDLTYGSESFIKCKNREYYGKAICDNDGTYRLIDCERRRTISEYPTTTTVQILQQTSPNSCENFNESRCYDNEIYRKNNTCSGQVCKRSECCESIGVNNKTHFFSGPVIVFGGFCCCVIFVLVMLFGLTASAAKSKGIVKSMNPASSPLQAPLPEIN